LLVLGRAEVIEEEVARRVAKHLVQGAVAWLLRERGLEEVLDPCRVQVLERRGPRAARKPEEPCAVPRRRAKGARGRPWWQAPPPQKRRAQASRAKSRGARRRLGASRVRGPASFVRRGSGAPGTAAEGPSARQLGHGCDAQRPAADGCSGKRKQHVPGLAAREGRRRRRGRWTQARARTQARGRGRSWRQRKAVLTIRAGREQAATPATKTAPELRRTPPTTHVPEPMLTHTSARARSSRPQPLLGDSRMITAVSSIARPVTSMTGQSG
jgi:hypothetical protein